MKALIRTLAVLLLLFPMAAHAALGGDVASIEADRAQIKGGVDQRQTSAYTVHEIQGATGTVVREYVSSAGNVFGVAWQGQFVPDMHQLLGAYYDQYVAAVEADKASYVGRRPLNLQLPGLVVQMNGIMRAYHGRAYIPVQVPAGVKAEELW
jgi:Protein of unknown function (DUF2844)